MFRSALAAAGGLAGALLLMIGLRSVKAAPGAPRPPADPAAYAVQASSSVTPTLFHDVSLSAGLTAPIQLQHMPGQAWADVNQDGWLDLYLTGGINPNVLYLNNGSGGFTVAPFSANVALTGTTSGGAAFGDYNNDGWPDLYVLANSEGGLPGNALLRNDNGTHFSDVTASAGVGDGGVGTSGSWGDYDLDGDLDLYVANWYCSDCPNGSRDTLYRNDGDGTFTDVSHLLGASLEGPGFIASFLDYDNDGDLDIYLVNDKAFSGTPPPPHPGHNILWRNDGAGCAGWCFTDVSVSAGAAVAVDGMGLAIGDYDNDGDLDMYFSNAGPQVLLQNQTSQGSPSFVDVSAAAGVAFDAIGWGTVFLDYDNDGLRDLYLATMNGSPALANRLYRNAGNGTFIDVSATSGADDTGQTFGVAYADYDLDGWTDLVIGNLGDTYTLFRNQALASPGNSWISVRLIGGGPVNRDAIGARAQVRTYDGTVQMQEVKSGSSLGSGNALDLYFGVGARSVEAITVTWPGGLTETFEQIQVNQSWSLAYPHPGLIWSPSQFHIAAPGRVVTYTYVLTNTGLRAEEISLGLSCVQGWGQLEAPTMPIDAGTFAEVRVVVSLPASAAGIEACTLTATSSLDPLYQQSVDLQVAIASSIIRLPWVEK